MGYKKIRFGIIVGGKIMKILVAYRKQFGTS